MIRLLDRHWLLTTTTYGTWLPGDQRGFVSPVRADDGTLELHNIPGTPYDADMPDLQQQAREFLKCDPIRLTRAQAEAILAQLLDTARYRGWTIVAASVMHNHLHILVTVPGDPAPSTLLQTFKSWASRALNDRWGKPPCETWWTRKGSKRKVTGEGGVCAGCRYVYNQPNWLARYADPGVPAHWLTPLP